MAASSAAGGSEIANTLSWVGHTIDQSLTTGYSRGACDHNNMQGVVVRGFGGTHNTTIPACLFFPGQTGSGLNPDCKVCAVTGAHECADGAVALHSTCGHNRVASFQDCNSNLAPHTDTAGTYSFHGWWITDR